MGRARLLDRVVDDRAEVRRVDDERLGGQLLERHRRLRGEPVALRQHRDERLAADDLDGELALADRRAQQPEVERAGEQSLDLRRRQELASQVEHDAGQRAAQRGGHLREERVRRRAGEPDREAPELAARRAPRVLGGAVDRGEDLACPREQDLAGGRELDAARRAVQQRHAELGLEPPDLLRERRLGHVQALGGAAEVAFLGDGDERAQEADLHPAIYISTLLNRSAISVAARRSQA